jgi:flagellum-specific peptidoglycan hydrolase FlgJ
MYNWSILIFIFHLLAGSFLHVKHPDSTSQYIETYKYLAIDEMNRTGIPASIILAQAIVESNSGTSELAIHANNHFGIKCKSYWRGSTYYHKDDDRNGKGVLIESCFRKYDHTTASFIDHSNFLVNTLHYRPLFNYARTDYKKWAQGLKQCGYATDKKYAEKLIKEIEKNQLQEYDYYVIRYE